MENLFSVPTLTIPEFNIQKFYQPQILHEQQCVPDLNTFTPIVMMGQGPESNNSLAQLNTYLELVNLEKQYCFCLESTSCLPQPAVQHGQVHAHHKQKSLGQSEKKEELYLKLLADFKYTTVKKYDDEKEKEVLEYCCGYDGCDKVLQKPWNLLDHLRMHEGVKPFECDWCGKKFTQKGNLKKHVRQHENPDVKNRKRYSCRFCGKGYTERYNLKAHVNKKHKDEMRS